MGWSCSKEASKAMERISAACRTQTNTQNAYRVIGGVEFFWEASRKEHEDGAITGSIFPMSGGGRVGTFRIEPDGTMSKGPKTLKTWAKGAEQGRP